ncbi:MAG: helix-turn-helix domain-containing protein [Phycisphaerae bacterium]|nr:helix-turn-helix domain-containing protein [Phycisphaerae bacterium]
MAGMFYSLKEAAKKLGRTEDQVKQLAKDGKLREFRDGSNLLFKIEEVQALVAKGIDVNAADLKLQELPAKEPVKALEDTAVPAPGESVEEDLFKLDEEATPALEATGEGDEAADLGLLAGLELEEPQAEIEPESAEEEAPGIGLEEPQVSEPAAAEEDLFLPEEPAQPAGEEQEQPLVADEAEGSSEEISLAPESGILSGGSDITDMDTALTGEGVNVLGETDTDYNVTEDSMAETAGPAASAGTRAEASLEEIEDDVSLDSFGSGSGLLDLSLQADDTSLGGILDEIYTAEGGEGDATPAEGEPAEAGAEVGEAASFDDITAEADHHAAEEDLAVPEPVAVMPAAMAPAYAEMAADAQGNILGALLFLPLLASLYTTIVTVSAFRKVMPSILSSIHGLIWYLVLGGIVLALVTFGISFTAGREKAPKEAKPKVDKKAKAEKSKKGAQAEKPAPEAPAKGAKEKKGLFGKKK